MTLNPLVVWDSYLPVARGDTHYSFLVRVGTKNSYRIRFYDAAAIRREYLTKRANTQVWNKRGGVGV